MSSPLIHLARRVLVLLAILVLADRLIGSGLERIFYQQHHGDDVVTRYTIDSTHEPLLVFGSSRASHHYETRLLEAALGMPVYNCGRDEMGISYTAAMLPLIYRRYSPQAIIIEVLPTELCSEGRVLGERHISTVLLPFAVRHPDLWQTVAFAGRDEVYKGAISRIYPFNSLPGSIIQNTYTGIGHTTDRGYEPLRNHIDSARYIKSAWMDYSKAITPDAALTARFISILDMAAKQGTQVFVMISPFYFPQRIAGNKCYEALQPICARHGARFMDWSADPRFILHPHLFNDDVHLNDSGARIYTRIITDTLRKSGVLPVTMTFAK